MEENINPQSLVILLLAIACVSAYFYGFREGIRVGGMTGSMAAFMSSDLAMTGQLSNADCDGLKQAIVDLQKNPIHEQKYTRQFYY